MVHPAYKICISLGADWRNQWTVHAAEAHLIELRIDLMFPKGVTTSEIIDTLSPLLRRYNNKTIITCRPGLLSHKERLNLFLAISSFASPAFFDLEFDTPSCYSLPLYKSTVKIIISYHNFIATPDMSQLCSVADTALLQGADLVKIVTLCHHSNEEARLLSLYGVDRFANRIIVFSIGEYALSSRLKAASLGAPILYAAPDHGTPTAPGQPFFSQLFPFQP